MVEDNRTEGGCASFLALCVIALTILLVMGMIAICV